MQFAQVTAIPPPVRAIVEGARRRGNQVTHHVERYPPRGHTFTWIIYGNLHIIRVYKMRFGGFIRWMYSVVDLPTGSYAVRRRLAP